MLLCLTVLRSHPRVVCVSLVVVVVAPRFLSSSFSLVVVVVAPRFLSSSFLLVVVVVAPRLLVLVLVSRNEWSFALWEYTDDAQCYLGFAAN